MGLTSRRTLLLGASGALAAPYILGSARAQAKVMKMTLADTVASPVFPICQRFAANVKARTNGAADIQVYGAGQLGSQANALTSLQTGIIDFVAHTTGFIETIFPQVSVLDLPFIFRDAPTAERVLDGPVGTELFTKFPDRGIYGLCWGHWGWRPISTAAATPMTHPSDMKGIKIRIQPGAIYAETYRAVGAIPVAIDITEAYLAMSQGAVQAVELPFISMVANKFQEVVKTTTETNFVYNAGALMVGKRKFDSLPADQQEAIRAAAHDMAIDWRKSVAEATVSAQGVLKAAGSKIVPADIDAYAAATKPIYDKFRTIIGPELVDAVLKQTGG
jgi:tripartite ATP-independent transporter DctP family solute receptor